MSATKTRTHYAFIDRYHYDRRREILDRHPEIRSLMIPDPSFKYVAAACALSQLALAVFLRNEPIAAVVGFSLVVGTLFNCAIANALHELAHDQAFPGQPLWNKVFGTLVNSAHGWPALGGYYRTHRNHHAYLGTDLDVKYPSIEEALRYDQSTWGRIKFVFCHPIVFGARWDAVAAKTAEPATDFMKWNFRAIWAFNLVWIYFVGWRNYVYLFLSFWLNDCVFIQGSKNYADHWVDEKRPYSRSYYGPVNLINFNIGYHREHHDFPNITGRYLPYVKTMAAEYYSDPKFRTNSIFGDVIALFLAPFGQGIVKHANKLSTAQAQKEFVD